VRARLVWLLAFALALESAWLLYPVLRRAVLHLETSPAVRGREVAGRMGCFACHGPDGVGGVPNPGSRWGEVPAFRGKVRMMFAQNEKEVEEYILNGAPRRRQAEDTYRVEIQQQALQMPAFRGWLSERELEDLLAYLRAVSGMLLPPSGPEARGAELAARYGCSHCHGEMGTGGQPNPGSLKGYIPAFGGRDFGELVKSEEELLGWIRDGEIPRLRENPVARRFLDRQKIRMPAYGRFLSAGEIADLAAYVRWLAETARLSNSDVSTIPGEAR